MRTAHDLGERPRRLLVMSYHFPPDGSVGGLRWAGMSKYLARRGWEVHVITAAQQNDQRSVPGVVVHYCPRGRTLNDVYNNWRNRKKTPEKTSTGTSSPATAEPTPSGGVVASIRANLAAILVLPDNGRGWIWRAARAARRELRERDFDAVVTSGPPHSTHVIGAFVSAGRPTVHCVDLRDPWAVRTRDGATGTVFNSHVMSFLLPRLERFVFRRNPIVVANTAELADVLKACYPQLKVSYVPNGIDPERLPPPATKKFDGLSIAYAGMMYLGRDLSPVVRALTSFLAQYPQARSAVRLRIAGDMDREHGDRFRAEVAAAGVDDIVETYGRVSSGEAMDLVNRSHLTLVLAQGQPIQVPAKLYECVAMGVTTLVIAEATSASAREAARVGAITCEAADVDRIRRVIEDLWLNRLPVTTRGAAVSYDAIAAKMESILLAGGEHAD